jgi:sec-independent protein translocase protein TatA
VFSQVGPGEIILVLAIALIVLGPKRLPSAAKSMGRSMREFKKSLSEADPRAVEDDEDDESAPKRAPAKTPAGD